MAVLAACGRTRVLLLTEQRGKPALRRGHLSKDLEGERPEAMASTRRRKEHRAAEGRSTGRQKGPLLAGSTGGCVCGGGCANPAPKHQGPHCGCHSPMR